ncbi:MAG: CHASE2 domain-containing protein [Elusimicrobia bacterium]|nr:CHASE2 domain-containing protein [Elusimicrobiota bacterium]
MKKFIFSNFLWGIALTLLTLFFYFTSSGIETAELKFYDFRSKISSREPAKSDIAIIKIDDESLSKIGRWPWPRSRISDLLVYLSSENAKPSVIGLNILFSEPEMNKEMEIAGFLKSKYLELVATKKIKEISKEPEFPAVVEKIMQDMDNDSRLTDAIRKTGNVVLPMTFQIQDVLSKPKEPGENLKKFALSVSHSITDAQISVEGSDITAPIEQFISSAAGIGHVNMFNDLDGAIRKEYPFIPYLESFYPSFALEIVRNHLKLKNTDVVINPGKTVSIGKTEIPLDMESSLLISFNTNKPAFKSYSFYDVINGKVVPEAFKDKIALIGLTAQGLGSLYVTPIENNLPAVEFTANAVENMLNGYFITRPEWSRNAELGLILFTGLFIILLLPRLKAFMGALLAGLVLAGFVFAGIYMFVNQGQWIKISYPSFLMTAGYIFIVTKKFFTTEKKKELIEVSAIETNKMLGLSFQGQGMLDLAFEKFRVCPLDGTMKDLLYNLALDFERKRQHNKAVAVYQHIQATDPKYKDINEKIEVLKKASEGAIFGGALGKTAESTLLVQGASATPTLGRYEITKELGKGAMGIVYLGKDPKINRTVAIKTMRFEEGIEEKALKELKDRFFREAQAAGNLSHPNIVKIFDAGEEQDIAYMAMELLKGDDLKKWTVKDNLFPVPKVLEYTALAADSLDYAHKNGVVHRDIKPANIMLLEDGTLRVTDFGIARIQASSKTATGTVLGTPYYMSPEQIAGKKVDGRADIFSLGVTFFELLTGEKPWKGGDSIGTLLFQIAQEPYPDPLSIRPDLPKDILKVIDKALKKNADERYQTAGEMAKDLRAILENKPLSENKPAQAAPAQLKSQPLPAVHPAPVKPQAAPQVAPPLAGLQAPKQENKIELTPRTGVLKPESPPKPDQHRVNTDRQRPITEALGQGQLTPTDSPPHAIDGQAGGQAAPAAPGAAQLPQAPLRRPQATDFEKTLPLIYPEEEKK